MTQRIQDEHFRLADQPHHQREIILPPSVQLGLRRRADRLAFVKPRLKLKDYIDRATAQPPTAVSRPLPAGFAWPMLKNDSLGDCVPVGKLHSVQAFHIVAGTPIPVFTDDDAVLWYEKDGGYNPSNPSTDGGCDEATAIQNWEDGMPQTSDGVAHGIAGTVAIDPTDDLECHVGIDEFVVIVNGIDLPRSAQGQTRWEVVGDPDKDPASQPGSWGGHCTIDWEYDPETYGEITWGEELLETLPFRKRYHSEAHVVVSKEMLNNSGVGPSGVQWDDLLSDLSKLPPVTS